MSSNVLHAHAKTRMVTIFLLALALTHSLSGLCAADGLLFESSWNRATGYSSEAIFDGGKWYGGSGGQGTMQDPYVSSGGPGGNNFLNMVTVGDGGWGNPYYFNWNISGGNNGDIFGDPDDLYIRVYFRVHDDYYPNGPMKHWCEGVPDGDRYYAQTYLGFHSVAGELPIYPNSPFVIECGMRFQANIVMEKERWYCYEYHIQKINDTLERRYIRLDGVDITDKFKCISGDAYGWWLEDWYAAGNGFKNFHHGNLWLNTYDMVSLNNGWDVACIEVRDDRWPGPIDAGPDTEPPSGTIEIFGKNPITQEPLSDRTGVKQVSLQLSAADSGSGMGAGAKMQFKNEGEAWSAQEDYATAKIWNLTDVPAGSEAIRKVYVKFCDVAGNCTTQEISDTILLDKKKPPTWDPSFDLP